MNYTTKCEEMYWKDTEGQRKEIYSDLIYCADTNIELDPLFTKVLAHTLQ